MVKDFRIYLEVIMIVLGIRFGVFKIYIALYFVCIKQINIL